MVLRIKKVLIAAGGTGGHLFPAIALAEELKYRGIEVLFVCSERPRDRQILEKNGYRFSILNMRPLEKGLRGFFNFCLWLTFSFFQAIFILLKFRPRVCVGFGGYTCVPLIISAKVLGLRTVIHEQNFIPGRANRVLANLVSKIAISFKESQKFLPKQEAIFTGNPIRKIILNSKEEDAYRFTGFVKQKWTILVMGGSQGSHRLNTILPEAFFLIDKDLKRDFQIIHLAGENELSLVEEAYRRYGIECRVFGFSDRVGLFYRISKLIIARSGATTIAEILAMRIPSILIPYPYAHRHQRVNARFLEDLGAAIVLEEDMISASLLAETIAEIFSNDLLLSEIKGSLNRLAKIDAAERLCEEVLNWGY